MSVLKSFGISLGVILSFIPAWAGSFETGRDAIRGMQGCYLVDYSYTETEGLKPDYVRDTRVYDVNSKRSVKELIYAIETSPRQIRLQHILFATDLDGKYQEGSVLRHQAEDWEFESKFLYEFTSPLTWNVKDTSAEKDSWTRRITNLDDGLRYQCSAPWNTTTAYAEWTCSTYAPIPGRETRDMGRKDYNTLQRTTRLMNYGTSFLERQNNIKTIHQADGSKSPLAKEEGKDWYVRLPDSECDPVRDFVKTHSAFWAILQQTWAEIYADGQPYKEQTVAGAPPRYMQMMELEERYSSQDLSIATVRTSAKQEVRALIEAYHAK